MEQRVEWRVVLTGGPCGGKSSALPHIKSLFESLGFKVFTVPEAATILLTSCGGRPGTDLLAFREELLRVTLNLEDAIFALARAEPSNSLVICDRGAWDLSLIHI